MHRNSVDRDQTPRLVASELFALVPKNEFPVLKRLKNTFMNYIWIKLMNWVRVLLNIHAFDTE